MNLRLLFIILAFGLIRNVVQAQTINLDSFRTVISQYPSDTTKLRVAFDIIQSIKTNHPQAAGKLAKDFYWEAINQRENAWVGKAATDVGACYFYTDQLDSALLYYNKAYQVYYEIPIEEGMAIALNNIGNVYIQKSEYDSARIYLYEALGLNQSRKDSFRILHDYGTIGLSFDYETDYDSALEYYYDALRIAEALNNDAFISQQLNNIGVVQMFRGDAEKALANFKKCLVIDRKQNDQGRMSSAYANMGLVYEDLHQLDSALTYQFKALAIDTTLKIQSRLARRYNNIGGLYEKDGDYKKAEQYYLESLKIKEALGNPEQIASTAINLGQLYVLMNKPVLAKKHLEQALAIALERGNLNWQKEAYDGLSQLYDQQGDCQKALVFYKQFKITHDSIFSKESELTINKLELQYESETQQKEIAQQALVIEKTKQQRIWFIMGLIILGLSSFILFLLFLRNRQQKRDIEKDLQALKKTNTELLQNLDKMEQHQKTPAYLADQLFTLETGGIQEIKLGDIIYIEASKNNTFFYTINGQHLERKHLKAVMEILPSELFLQVKRFYTINVLQIKKRTKRDITLSNGEMIRIGATFRESVDSFFDENKNKD